MLKYNAYQSVSLGTTIVGVVYNDGVLNRLDRLTAANYGMPINTNLCENRFRKSSSSLLRAFLSLCI